MVESSSRPKNSPTWLTWFSMYSQEPMITTAVVPMNSRRKNVVKSSSVIRREKSPDSFTSAIDAAAAPARPRSATIGSAR